MVGPPRTISDLARLDANPVVACQRCTWRVEYDRDRLNHLRIAAGLSTDWRTFCHETRCETCSAPVRVSIKPFVTDAALRSGDLKQTMVFKALCVLDEAQAAAKQGRVAPSFGLRFALAYLYAVGERRAEWFDREPYIEFWRVATMQTSVSNGINGGVAGSARATALGTCVNGIARAAGMEMTPELMARIGQATKRSGEDGTSSG